MNKKVFFIAWLLGAGIFTLCAGLVYFPVQQILRQGANDPQIQMAEDGAHTLSYGAEFDFVIPGEGIVPIETSLSPYIIIFNESGKAVAGSGSLRGTYPTLPSGVFAYAKENGENRITWQPEEGIRHAIVVVPYTSKNKSGFVMSGRSLREVEKRESALGHYIFFGWLASLIFLKVFVFCAYLFLREKK